MSDDKVCVKVKIFGNEYSFSAHETEEYVKKVCSYVDEKMNTVMSDNPGLSAYNLAVMTCVNISDEYHKKLEKDLETEKDIKEFNNIINDLSSKLTILEKENDYLRQVIESLNERIKEYEG